MMNKITNHQVFLQKKDDFDSEEFGESGIDHDFVRITYDIVLSLVSIIKKNNFVHWW